MVKIYLEERKIEYKDWEIWIREEELIFTIIYPSGKKFYCPYNENIVHPSIKRKEKLLFSKKHQRFYEIESVTEVGKKYFLVTYPSSKKIYCFKCNEVELMDAAGIKDENIWRYFETVAQEREENAKPGKAKTIAANVVRQFERIIPYEGTALHAYITQNLIQCFPPEDLIYPFGINETQMKAVKNAFVSQLSIIEGPPGTGKTQTILNIIANIIVNGKTCAIVSNNNSAVENVYEKLEKHKLDFLVAKLGKSDNKETFFDSINYKKPDAETQVVTIEEIKTIFNRLEKHLYSKNKLAQVISQIQEIEIEIEYLNKWSQKYPEIKVNYIDKYNLDHIKAVDLMTYIKFLEDKSLTLKDKWNLLLNYKIFRSRFLNNIKDRESFIFSLQLTYYERILKEKEEEKAELENILKEADFSNELEKLRDRSLKFLYQYIIRNMPENIPEFTSKNYQKDFSKFMKYFPIIGSSTHSLVSSIAKGYLLDYVIIDEASQQDLVPGILCFGCARNVIIVGDRKQLSHIAVPTQNSSPDRLYDCTKYNLLDSVGEIFGEKVPRTMLKEHYRCHPKIIQFCNKQFYDNQLITMTEDKGENALSLTVTALGNHMRDYKNQREIESVMKSTEICGFLENEELGDGHTIGFIAPYNKQIELAEKMMPEEIVKNTIHKFQGRECDEIIFSTVLDKKAVSQRQLDFVDNAALINVAVSRAKSKFTLVTGQNVFDKNNKHIAALIRYIEYYATEEEIYNSPVISAFDLLYSEYDKSLEKLLAKLNSKDSRYRSEQIVAALLREILELEEFNALIFHMQIYLKQLVSSENEIFSKREAEYINNRASCDFVIYYHIGKKPLAVIEVDGGYHDRPEQIERDNVKNSILKKAGIPLLRVRTTDSNIEDKLIAFIKENIIR